MARTAKSLFNSTRGGGLLSGLSLRLVLLLQVLLPQQRLFQYLLRGKQGMSLLLPMWMSRDRLRPLSLLRALCLRPRIFRVGGAETHETPRSVWGGERQSSCRGAGL